MVWRWSKTAATNANADSTINWAEGMAPSAVNDSARAEMARVAQWRDDISGALVTTGSATAYAVSSNQVFDTLANMNGAMIAFTPHTTNGATVTLNVDGLGAKPLRISPGIELQSGVLISGAPYVATYSNADAAWYLRGLGGNPYGVPVGAGMDYWGLVTPSSAFVFPTGQAVSRTTYSVLFGIIGSYYGSGDGSTTFNLPDKRGRVTASIDNMGGVAANRLSLSFFGGDPTIVGGVGGGQANTITRSNLPNVAPAFTGSGSVYTVATTIADVGRGASQVNLAAGGSGIIVPTTYQQVTSTGVNTPSGTVESLNGNVAQTGMGVIQPTIVCSYIMRII